MYLTFIDIGYRKEFQYLFNIKHRKCLLQHYWRLTNKMSKGHKHLHTLKYEYIIENQKQPYTGYEFHYHIKQVFWV